MSYKGKKFKHLAWRSYFRKTESGWYVYYDDTLGVTYVMDEALVNHVDTLKPRDQVDMIADLFSRAGSAIGMNGLVELPYGM